MHIELPVDPRNPEEDKVGIGDWAYSSFLYAASLFWEPLKDMLNALGTVNIVYDNDDMFMDFDEEEG